MKARRLIESSSLPPETLRTVFKAFDDAWSEISDHFQGDERVAEQARMRLARAVLSVVLENSEGVERVKDEALQMMALAYRKTG